MDEFLHSSKSLRSIFENADLSIENFVKGCNLIFDEQENMSSTEMLGLKDTDLTDTDFQAILEILGEVNLVDLKGRDYVILATPGEFKAGIGELLSILLNISHEEHRINWSVEDKMVLIKSNGTVRFSTSIFFRWCEVFLYLLRKRLYIDKQELLEQFSLMTESRNNYCIQILEQQELIIDTVKGIFTTVLPSEIEEWLENMKEDLKMGYDLGS